MRNKKMVIVGVLLFIAAFLTGLFLYFDRIIGGEWDSKRKAVETAYAQTMLAKAERVEPYVGSEPYMIVYGEDKIGKKMIVWVSANDLHAAYETEGIMLEAAAAKVTAANPANVVLRTTPGKLEQEYVWEVYYQREQDGQTRYFYDYYRYGDGALIDTFRLGGQ
jgi:uncharacterized protein YpmB